MIKVGFIGAGDIAYLHGEGVSSSANAELTGIWNRTRSKAEEKAELFRDPGFRQRGRIDRSSRRRVYPHQHGNPSFLCHAGHRSRQACPCGKTHCSHDSRNRGNQGSGKQERRPSRSRTQLYLRTHRHADQRSDRKRKAREIVSIYVLYNIHHPEEVAARYPG